MESRSLQARIFYISNKRRVKGHIHISSILYIALNRVCSHDIPKNDSVS